MAVDLTIICVVVVVARVLINRIGDRRELERHTITPEALYVLLASNRDVLVIDVRQPFDLLGNSVIIQGAVWFAPQQVIDDPSLLPGGRDLIVYGTCPSDKMSLAVLQQALVMGFSRIKLLKGGLDSWRARGYPVEPYAKPFHLDSSRSGHLAAAS